jgi:hypothetical protein
VGVFLWSRRLFGEAGGLLSATLAAASPTLGAHGALATSDLFGAATMLLATWTLARLGRRVSPGRVVACSLALAAALLSKASALLLLPVGGALALAALLRAGPLVLSWGRRSRALAGRGGRAAALVPAALALALLTAGWLWAAYAFREGITPPGATATLYFGGWPHVETVGGVAIGMVTGLRDLHLLPEAWVYGLGFVLAHAAGRAAFLDGAFDPMGFPDFFPRAFLYKTPPALLGLLALVLVVALAGALAKARRGGGARAAPARPGTGAGRVLPLLLLVAAVALASLGSRLNIGHRHLLPLYPPLFVLCGAALGPRPVPRARGAAALLLLGWFVVDGLAVRPHALAYFSPLAGGPAQGYRHLVDSSLDWGQDLPGLARRLDALRTGPDPPARVYLSYFGKGHPDAEGIEATHLPFVPDTLRRVESYPLQGGLYCIGATMLQLVYLPVGVPWTTGDERAWLACKAEVDAMEASQPDPAAHAAVLARRPHDAWNRLLHEYEVLRFARLCAFLRAREPDEQVGYSINLYRLDDAEARLAVYGPPAELVTDPRPPPVSAPAP